MLFEDFRSKVDGNENDGSTLEEDPLMSNEDEDHHDLFNFLCIFNLHWRIQNYFGVLNLFEYKGGQNPNVITYFTFKFVTKSYETLCNNLPCTSEFSKKGRRLWISKLKLVK